MFCFCSFVASSFIEKCSRVAMSMLSDLRLLASATREPPSPPEISSLHDKDCFWKEKWGCRFQIKYALPSVRLLHIGKCGGTTIRHAFFSAGVGLDQYHMKKPDPQKINEWLIVWVRNPYDRFVSAFNHSKAILDYPIDAEGLGVFSLRNCIAPSRIQKKVLKGAAFNPLYEKVLQAFNSANELAESLTSSSYSLKTMAIALVKSREEHLYKGIGWHLSGGRFIEKHHKRILMVGRVEHFSSDLTPLGEKLGLKLGDLAIPQRSNLASYPKGLSPKAIRNLNNFCLSSDFQALEAMMKYEFIQEETINAYSRASE